MIAVPFGSDPYFDLAARSPEVARYLSVGTPLVLVLDDAAYSIVEGEASLPDATPRPTERAADPTATPNATATSVAVAGASTPQPLAAEAAARDAVERPGATPLVLIGGLIVLATLLAARWTRQRRQR